MRHYEFSYTVTATGVRNTFTIPDPAEDSYGIEVARAVNSTLTRLTNLSDITAALVTDTREVTRTDVPSPP